MIKGINHVTLAVKNVERSFQFYVNVLGLRPLALWPQGAYMLAGSFWLALTQDPATRTESLPEYTHLAFTVKQQDFNLAAARIKASGARIWKENKSEGDSLYFEDPDGHKLEIHVGSWESRLAHFHKYPKPGLKLFD